MLKQFSKQAKYLYLLIYILAGIRVLFRGPIYYPDSYAFLRMAINRSPVYSTFVKFFTSVFGDYYEYPLLISQYLIMVFATHFLLKILHKELKLHVYSVLFFQMALLANAVMWYFSVNKVLSESLAFPLVLILAALLFKSIVNKSFLSLFKAIAVLFLLQFTRGQFVVFIPVLLCIAICVFYQTKDVKKGVLSIVILVLIPVLISFSERVYNKIVINEYKNYTMTYVHFIAAPFYLANSNDVSIFKNEEEKEFFSRTFKELEAKKLTLGLSIEKSKAPYSFFETNFTKICNATVHEFNMDYYGSKGLSYFEQQYKVDELTTKMFKPLLKQNFKKWVLHVKRSFTKGVGGKAIYYLLLMVLVISTWLFVKSKDNIFLFLSLLIVLKFANNLIIAMVVHSIDRYTFYFDWIIFAALILLFNPLIKKYSKFN